MGNDGGTIAKRDEVVKLKKKDQQIFDKEQIEYGKWFLCKLAQNQLCDPIVIDDLGNLFNKDKVIEALLDGSLQNSKSFSHIRSLKSIYDVHFALNPAFEKDNSVSPWLCPITKIEVGSQNYKFKFIKSCGHVLSDKSFKELNNNNSNSNNNKSDSNNNGDNSNSCFLCSKVYNQEEDIIIINPNNEELEQMKLKLKERLENSKSNKKKKSSSSKKRSLDNLNETNNNNSNNNGGLASESSFTTNTLKQANEELNKKMKSEAFSSIFKSNNNSATTTTTTTTTTTSAKSK